MGNNLKCTVSNCMHHKDAHCCLESIWVSKTAPKDAVNAVCSSFVSGQNSSMSAQERVPKNDLDIKCNARNCKYNIENICSSLNVTIALTKNDAECTNFKAM